MEIDSQKLREILPKRLRKICRIGICNPKYLEKEKPVYCPIPEEYGGARWSAKPSDVLSAVETVIVLIHFTPVAADYAVENIILSFARGLWKTLGIKTHVLDIAGNPDKGNIIGREDSFLKYSLYDARKKMILLKSLAYYSGLGQYGNNSLIINKDFGSDLKIQALFTQDKLKYDKPILPKQYPNCKNCNICMTSYPAKIIDDYKVSTKHDSCRHIIKGKDIIIGRIPKKYCLHKNALNSGMIACRACQSFCPVNQKHYIKNSLILVRRQKTGVGPKTIIIREYYGKGHFYH